MRPKPLVLAIADGFGVAPPSDGNAIAKANTPNLANLIKKYPAATIVASGAEVGLQFGEHGNSEVGHFNIGAGRVNYQMFLKINDEITKETFFKNPVLIEAMEYAKNHNSRLQLIGLVSRGNVHASLEHLFALLDLAKKEKVKEVYVHCILDGRDAIYNAGLTFVKELEAKMAKIKLGKIASLIGRYYAMDRDNRWDRVQKAYDLMALGKGESATNAVKAIEANYSKKIYDEEFPATVISENGAPLTKVEKYDSVIFYNFREDRARELTKAFAVPTFSKFERPEYLKDLYFATFTEYEANLPVHVAFHQENLTETLGEVIAANNLTQLHIAETEKYAHVTFFINGGREEPFPGEDRILIPSAQVANYNEKPEMKAAEITKKVIVAINDNKYDVIVLNFANADMVAHTGDFAATKKAVEIIDVSIGQIAEAVLAKGGILIFTADHGNAEELINLKTGAVDKEHSTNPVPFLLVGKQFEGQTLGFPESPSGDLSLVAPIGILADVAPTILKILGLPQPPLMTGTPLIE